MKRRWMVIGLLCGGLCISGCSGDRQTPEDDTKKQEAESRDSEEDIVKDTELEPGTGEGSSSMELDNLSQSTEYSIGDVISLSADGKKYELQIDSAAYMEPSNEYTEDPGNVVVVNYSYHNLSDEPLLIGEIRFQLTDSEQKEVYEPYYFSEQVVSEQVEKGERSSAQAAFSGMDEDESLTLVYTDISAEDFVPVLINLGEIKGK